MGRGGAKSLPPCTTTASKLASRCSCLSRNNTGRHSPVFIALICLADSGLTLAFRGDVYALVEDPDGIRWSMAAQKPTVDADPTGEMVLPESFGEEEAKA